MNIFFFSQVPLEDEEMENNRENKEYRYGEEKGISNCSTYNSGIAKVVSQHINSKFDKVIYVYDELKNYINVNNAVENDLTSDNSVVDSENIIKVLYKKGDRPEEIIEKICEQSGDIFNSESKLYIATNGGNRNNMMFFLTFIEIMSCRGVETLWFYADGEKGKKEEKVLEINNNKIYKLLRAVELFVEFGNPIKLIDCYEDNNNKDLKALFECMKKFYYSIQVCRRVSEKGLLDTYRDLIKHIEDINQKYVINNGLTGDDNSDSDKIPTELKLLIPHIKSRFVKEDIEGKELIHIIQWCLDNNNITLGYFIFDVELIKFLREKKVLKNTFPEPDNIPKRYRKRYEKMYNLCNKHKKIGDKCGNIDYERKKTAELIKRCSSELEYNPDRRFSQKNKGILKKYGFDNDDYQIVSICTIVRRIRNSIAHSNNYDVLYNSQFLKSIIESYENKYNEELFTGKETAEDSSGYIYKIEADDDNYFTIIKNLLKYMLDDIKEMIG